MKYLLLVHHDEEAFNKISEATRREMLAESIRLCHQLHPAATGTVLRMREGKEFVTDGPFVETKEQLAGYFLIEAKHLDEALAVAGRVPGARIGTVEVGPVREITGLPAEQQNLPES
jgi:hypothetical protein